MSRVVDSNTGAVSIPDGLYASVGTLPSSSALAPQAVYNGGYTNAAEIYVRIATGGSGQSGLIGAWADAFIKYSVSQGQQPFLVGWYLGDTTESLGLLEAGSVDIAVTYNEAAELQKMNSKVAVRREYGFRDHFYLVGPSTDINPAALKDDDDILTMFNKIVTTGNAHAIVIPSICYKPDYHGVPWALAYSKWYHQYPQFPLQALKATSVLNEYTITDRGTWLSSDDAIVASLHIYKQGGDSTVDPLLNPAHVLLGSKVEDKYKEICKGFMDWVVMKDGGQKVIREFKKKGQVLYSEAPTSK
ncbi:hypothetical protein GLOTRDRAFT_106548 [Gloeophyllum trabeum ATCC 11539]|uniref:PBP domain-containing protein n=1 Tax=Gloeophyllum trabeum (strain ATCC 11539 / FP-39264 / Madison 617) TaxID=670483 RepID=S7RMP4_GLOTA|nr:uncharacterized protein GLOTRDRAFT_106548 [Gloeophyllum trabeum ATCC 11539]EPQ53954.1 hypothetical protein GLOTRDRAFT_106548 [Gloeophyllum trabeum ATCC 11539]